MKFDSVSRLQACINSEKNQQLLVNNNTLLKDDHVPTLIVAIRNKILIRTLDGAYLTDSLKLGITRRYLVSGDEKFQFVLFVKHLLVMSFTAMQPPISYLYSYLREVFSERLFAINNNFRVFTYKALFKYILAMKT